MIFQASIDLNIEGKAVQATIDFDTGMIGFVETDGSKSKEYDYFSAPPEYKIALAKAIEKIMSQKHQSNGLICHKSQAAQVMREYWGNAKLPKR